MNRSILIVILATTALLSDPMSAFSYVDPGTGSAVFGSLAYLLAAGGTALAFLIRPIKRFLSSLGKTGSQGQD